MMSSTAISPLRPRPRSPFRITWGTAGSHNGVFHSALAAGKSQEVWRGLGSGYSATLTCARTATGELSAHYSDTNKDRHDANPVAKGCSTFAMQSSPGHTVQCCFPSTGCWIGKWASSTPNAGFVSFGRHVPVPTPPTPQPTPPKVCSLNVSSVADTGGDSGLNGMYEPTSHLHNNRWVLLV